MDGSAATCPWRRRDGIQVPRRRSTCHVSCPECFSRSISDAGHESGMVKSAVLVGAVRAPVYSRLHAFAFLCFMYSRRSGVTANRAVRLRASSTGDPRRAGVRRSFRIQWRASPLTAMSAEPLESSWRSRPAVGDERVIRVRLSPRRRRPYRLSRTTLGQGWPRGPIARIATEGALAVTATMARRSTPLQNRSVMTAFLSFSSPDE